jgi:hypothetical protein
MKEINDAPFYADGCFYQKELKFKEILIWEESNEKQELNTFGYDGKRRYIHVDGNWVPTKLELNEVGGVLIDISTLLGQTFMNQIFDGPYSEWKQTFYGREFDNEE